MVRANLAIGDLMALLTAVFLAVQRRRDDIGLRDRVWAVVFDGLHADHAGRAQG